MLIVGVHAVEIGYFTEKGVRFEMRVCHTGVGQGIMIHIRFIGLDTRIGIACEKPERSFDPIEDVGPLTPLMFMLPPTRQKSAFDHSVFRVFRLPHLGLRAACKNQGEYED